MSERQGRSEAALDPNQPRTRDNWYATHLAAHERLFPFGDNLATLMFLVGSDVNEAQRERLTSSHSLRNTTVTAYTLDTVQPVFVELFCALKNSMENPSLRVSGSGSDSSRAFIAENYPEDDYGLVAIDESTGEQGYADDERSCSWTWDDNEYVWQCGPFKSRQVKRRKGKRKRKWPRGVFKRIGNAYLGEEQTQGNVWWQERERRPFEKERTNFLKTILVLFFKIKVQTRSSSQTKEHQSRRGKESSYSQSGFSASETRSEEGYGHSWETISILQVQLQEELLHGMARDILHGWRQFL